MKSVQIRSFSGLYFPVFGLDTDQKNSVFGPFLRNVLINKKPKILTDRYQNWLINYLDSRFPIQINSENQTFFSKSLRLTWVTCMKLQNKKLRIHKAKRRPKHLTRSFILKKHQLTLQAWITNVCLIIFCKWHCVKSVSIRSFFWSVFSRIRIEYGHLLCKTPYSIQIRENIAQKNSVFGHFSRSVSFRINIYE